MTLEEKINFLKNKWEANKMAIITDSKNNEYICTITHNKTSSNFALSIEMYDTELNDKGYIDFFRDPNNRLFLSSIYVYWSTRGLGLATKLNNLAEFVLRKEAGKIIRGRFMPYNHPQDTSLPSDLSKEEQEFFAKKFYKSNGYQIYAYEDFKTNPDKFPNLNKFDFECGCQPAERIVVKTLPKLDFYPFTEENGLITEIAPEEILEK